MSKRRIKKLTGHKFFAKDPDLGTEFYVKLNGYSDLSVLVFDPSQKTLREFILDTGGLLAIYQFSEGREITPLESLQHMNKPPYYIKLISKGSQTLSARESRLYAAVLLANVTTYGEDKKAITLRRAAYLPSKDDFLMGIDTLTLSLDLAQALMDMVKKLFGKKGLEIELEEILDRGEKENAID